jgi:translation initiation factor IF-2
MAAKVKVNELAKKHRISPKEVVTLLRELGFECASSKSTVPGDAAKALDKRVSEDRDAARQKRAEAKEARREKAPSKEIHLKSPIVVKALAEALDKKPNEVVSALMSMNVLANINQTLEADVATKLCDRFDVTLIVDKRGKAEKKASDEEAELEALLKEDDPSKLVDRPPIVTFMGHVDHGKTSIQDKIRATNVVDREAGGITQHIGASVIEHKGQQITFIDTPGHAAFTSMRARGANVTDIAILVVAADDGFMPQTIEAVSHAKAANVPIIVAINKMDLPGANPDKILTDMQRNNLMSEDWGGDVGVVKVSAMTGEGLDELLERIHLEAEMLEIKANPDRPAEAVVLESRLEQGFGPTANVIVMNGTLRKGDSSLCGEFFGKVRTMVDETGKTVKEAGPSTPVKVVGLSGTPEAGSKLVVLANEKEAKRIAEERTQTTRESELSKPSLSLDELLASFGKESKKRLPIVLKADVQGSLEAIAESLAKFPSEKITVETIHSAVGAITENDILLAAASQGIIVGFHVKVNPGVNKLAEEKNVEIRLYSVIYELLEDIEEALTGRLAPDEREKDIGNARILQIFDVSKGPNVIGCLVEKGMVRVGAKARVKRAGELLYNGTVKSLRRFQDDVKEVKSGLECGIRLDNFADFKEGDEVQLYEVEFKKASL